jgi:hypothetical protein
MVSSMLRPEFNMRALLKLPLAVAAFFARIQPSHCDWIDLRRLAQRSPPRTIDSTERFQFKLRTVFWVTLLVAVLMVPVSEAVRIYLDIKHIYTVEWEQRKKEGRPLPGQLGYKRDPNPYRIPSSQPATPE